MVGQLVSLPLPAIVFGFNTHHGFPAFGPDSPATHDVYLHTPGTLSLHHRTTIRTIHTGPRRPHLPFYRRWLDVIAKGLLDEYRCSRNGQTRLDATDGQLRCRHPGGRWTYTTGRDSVRDAAPTYFPDHLYLV